MDERTRGRGKQYLVRWIGYGPESDLWLPRSELLGTQALENWSSSKKTVVDEAGFNFGTIEISKAGESVRKRLSLSYNNDNTNTMSHDHAYINAVTVH